MVREIFRFISHPLGITSGYEISRKHGRNQSRFSQSSQFSMSSEFPITQNRPAGVSAAPKTFAPVSVAPSAARLTRQKGRIRTKRTKKNYTAVMEGFW